MRDCWTKVYCERFTEHWGGGFVTDCSFLILPFCAYNGFKWTQWALHIFIQEFGLCRNNRHFKRGIILFKRTHFPEGKLAHAPIQNVWKVSLNPLLESSLAVCSTIPWCSSEGQGPKWKPIHIPIIGVPWNWLYSSEPCLELWHLTSYIEHPSLT